MATTTALPLRPARQGGLSFEGAWGIVLLTPYIAVFLLFVVYPILYGAWLGSSVEGYLRLLDDPIYWRTVRNTLIFLLAGVSLKMVVALSLSSFFVLPYFWVRVVGVLFILPWAVPHIPSILSIRWFLNSEWGMLNNLIWQVTGAFGPAWLSDPSYAFASIIAVHIWKYLPFWTLILVAGRMAISRDLYEAAVVDGASPWQSFRHVTFPQIRNLFITSTLLTTIWSLGDFNSVYLLTGGGPAERTNTLATLGIRYAFGEADLSAGVATMISGLPLLIPLVVLLLRRLNKQSAA
jgi:multiple sugar transport system permease protein